MGNNFLPGATSEIFEVALGHTGRGGAKVLPGFPPPDNVWSGGKGVPLPPQGAHAPGMGGDFSCPSALGQLGPGECVKPSPLCAHPASSVSKCHMLLAGPEEALYAPPPPGPN